MCSTPSIVEIERPAREPVDENNPIVLELVDADYPVESSISAVARGGTLKAALKILDEQEEKDEDKHTSSNYKRQGSGPGKNWLLLEL